MPRVTVTSEAFDPGAVLTAFTAGLGTRAGAVVSFTGTVRDLTGDLREMRIEHYPGMTERAIREMADQAAARFELAAVEVLHRHGPLRPGEPIMMVLTAAAHRRAAFEAADFLMDYLKSRAPFWKQEVTGRGTEWVAARDEDEDALNRW